MLKLTKRQINQNLMPHLSKGKRGPNCKVGFWRIVRAILYRMRTGVQWRHLPMASLFGRHLTSWQSVYHHFSNRVAGRWCKDGSWHRLWIAVLDLCRELLDMSSVEFDGSHTLAKRGGQQVGYQGRKKAKTTNMLFLTDRQGMPLACSDPMCGKHNDLFEIEKSVHKMMDTLHQAGILTDGLFLNGDAGFDARKLREICSEYGIIPNIISNKRNKATSESEDYLFDSQLYEERFVVERTNAWIDGFKALLMRYETNAKHWLGVHYLAFSFILLRRKGIWAK
jgi:transposase